MSNKPKQRKLDGRYKPYVDKGTMSSLNVPLPLKEYSTLKVNSELDVEVFKQKRDLTQKLKDKARKKFLKRKKK